MSEQQKSRAQSGRTWAVGQEQSEEGNVRTGDEHSRGTVQEFRSAGRHSLDGDAAGEELGFCLASQGREEDALGSGQTVPEAPLCPVCGDAVRTVGHLRPTQCWGQGQAESRLS